MTQASVEMSSTTEYYAGQLPHPDHLERFEQICPGATDRMLRMTEKQSDHRQWMEKAFMLFNGSSQILGTVSGAALMLGGIFAAGYLSMHDKSIEGFVAFILSLGTVAAVFVTGRRAQQREKEQKAVAEQR